MIVDWLVIIWRWTWVVIMIMPIDSRCSLLIDYDEKHDWWFSDDNWSWLMNDDKGHRWWFIVIDNEVMDDKWLTDLLIDDKIMIMITKSVIIPAVSGLYRPTGLLSIILLLMGDQLPFKTSQGVACQGFLTHWSQKRGLPFYRNLQMNKWVKNMILYFDSNSTRVCSQVSSWQCSNISFDIGLAPKRW